MCEDLILGSSLLFDYEVFIIEPSAYTSMATLVEKNRLILADLDSTSITADSKLPFPIYFNSRLYFYDIGLNSIDHKFLRHLDRVAKIAFNGVQIDHIDSNFFFHSKFSMNLRSIRFTEVVIPNLFDIKFDYLDRLFELIINSNNFRDEDIKFPSMPKSIVILELISDFRSSTLLQIIDGLSSLPNLSHLKIKVSLFDSNFLLELADSLSQLTLNKLSLYWTFDQSRPEIVLSEIIIIPLEFFLKLKRCLTIELFSHSRLTIWDLESDLFYDIPNRIEELTEIINRSIDSGQLTSVKITFSDHWIDLAHINLNPSFNTIKHLYD